MSLFDINNKIVCVTGASSGIGKSLATFLAEKGAKVVGVARRKNELSNWKKNTNGETSFLSINLLETKNIKHFGKEISKQFGPPDILINAAGINNRQHANDVNIEGWETTINLNLSAPFFLAQSLVENMKKKKWGRIINIASLQTKRAFPSGLSYGASKGGVEQLTRAMAEAWSPYGINTNAIAPGFFPTDLTKPVFKNKELSSKNASQTCIGRNGVLEDLHGPILFFCSKASNYVTGQTLFVDGGYTAK